MIAAAAGALLSLPSALIGGYRAIKQHQMAKKLKMRTDMPEGFKEKLGATRLQANDTTMPGQTQMENKTRQATSDATARIKEMGSGSANMLAAASGAQANENANMESIGQTAAAYQTASKDKLNAALGEKAGYEEQNRQEFNATKSALEGASQANQEKSLKDIGSIGMSALSGSMGGGAASGMGAGVSEAMVDVNRANLQNRAKKYDQYVSPYPVA